MKRPSMFERLKAGLEDGIAHERGDIELKSYTLDIPQPPKEYSPDDVRALRVRYQMSQSQLAKLLYVSKKTVQGWEQGLRRPASSAARLLQFIENPALLRLPSDAHLD